MLVNRSVCGGWPICAAVTRIAEIYTISKILEVECSPVVGWLQGKREAPLVSPCRKGDRGSQHLEIAAGTGLPISHTGDGKWPGI